MMLCNHDSPTFKSQPQSKQCATSVCTCTLRSALQQNALGLSEAKTGNQDITSEISDLISKKKSPSHSYDPAALKLSATAQLSRKSQPCHSPQGLMATTPSSLTLSQSSGQCPFAQHRPFQATRSLILWAATDAPLFNRKLFLHHFAHNQFPSTWEVSLVQLIPHTKCFSKITCSGQSCHRNLLEHRKKSVSNQGSAVRHPWAFSGLHQVLEANKELQKSFASWNKWGSQEADQCKFEVLIYNSDRTSTQLFHIGCLNLAHLFKARGGKLANSG